MISRRQIVLGAPLLGAWCAPASAQVRDINDAINKAGRQRMLSQRMAKAYLALGQGVRREQAERVLADSMSLFDRQLVELRAYAPRQDIRQVYERLESTWGGYKTALVGALPTKPGSETVLALSGQVLAQANQGTQLLEAASGRPVGKLVNVAGRQRMLSQRMAAMYLAASWGVQPEPSSKAMNAAREEFGQAQEVLRAAPEATPAILEALGLADQQFGFFVALLGGLKPGQANARAQADAFTTSERILQMLDEVTALFARGAG